MEIAEAVSTVVPGVSDGERPPLEREPDHDVELEQCEPAQSPAPGLKEQEIERSEEVRPEAKNAIDAGTTPLIAAGAPCPRPACGRRRTNPASAGSSTPRRRRRWPRCRDRAR